MILGSAALVVLIIVAATIGSSGNGRKTGQGAGSTHAAAAPKPTPSGKVFFADVQTYFPDLAAGGRGPVVSLGQSICEKRSQGIGQKSIIEVFQKNDTFGINSQEFVRLAETDLCPSYLAPVIALPKPKPHVIATFTGNGDTNTAPFTIPAPGNWYLEYSYDCSNFGGSGNFAVDEGVDDFNGVTVNELSPGAHDKKSYAYNDAGTHHLEILSECNWAVKVVTK